MLRASLCVVLLTAGLAPAQAPVPQSPPPPPPLETTPATPPAPEAPAPEAAPPLPPAPTHLSFGLENFQPTAALGFSIELLGSSGASIAGWLGVAMHPVPGDEWSGWVALGAELNGYFPFSGPGTFEFVPELRGGMSWVRSPTTAWVSRLFPHLEVYTLVGLRTGTSLRKAAVRIGAGVSFIEFAAWQARLSTRAPGLPWAIELTYDFDTVGILTLRILYHF
ncbi:MAG: hypothetical protein IT380_10270 [Myxococcales bacterium]|nr:hypothetical protein [Myxococcales bacterium]